MENNSNGVGDFIKNIIKNGLKKVGKAIVLKLALPVIIIFIVIAGCVLVVKLADGVFKQGDQSNAPYMVSTYTNSVSIDEDGNITTEMTAQELWNEMVKHDNRIVKYLDSPEELVKLMNAQLVTQYPDTRKDPTKSYDWDKINDKDSNKVQGIIKFKRADENNNITTLSYVSPTKFQEYIDNYNSTGNQKDLKEVMKHYTLEKATSSDTGTASPIAKGTTINIPSGLGSVHTYMGWQCITSTTSTQYKLREKAGMNFDDEGFGKINGRYVIACTTTYGTIGDYIDFYQEDGTIIPCIIGDIKNQNDAGCTKWGHLNGTCIIEFIVNKDTWYTNGSGSHTNPGTSNCHSEWHQNLTKAVNGGSYFDDSSFGADNVKENGSSTDTGEMKWPSDSTTITSTFGPRSAPLPGASTNHGAVDIGTPIGTNVYACESGTIETATNAGNAGNMVTINHGNGFVSKYMHLSEFKVKKGETVNKGQIIALSGNTGNSTGPHLHFQLEKDGTKVDPLDYKYDKDVGNGTEGIGSTTGGNNEGFNGYYAKVATISEYSNKIESNDSATDSSNISSSTLGTKTFRYDEFVSGYTMPFDYLWAYLVISEDKNFSLDLADLVYGSEIEITIHDNLEVNTEEVVDTYTKKKKTETTAKVIVNYGQESSTEHSAEADESWTDEESNDYKVAQTTVTTTDTLDIALTKANVWIVDHEQEFTYQEPVKTDSSNVQNLEDIPYPENPDETTQNQDTYGHATALLNSQIEEYKKSWTVVGGYVNSIEEKIYNATVNRKKTTTNTIETTKYVSLPATNEEKTDKKATEPNFVTIFLSEKCRKARNIILNAKEWLFKILEENDTTKNMVDLTKYLLYKATGRDYGVKEYDFSTFDPSTFTDTENENNDSDFDNFKKWLHNLEGGSVSSDGKYYIVESDGSSTGSAVGHGVDIGTHGAELRKAGYSTTIGSKIPIDVVDAIEEKEIQSNIKTVKSKSKGLDLTQYQIYAMVARTYNCGAAGAFTTRNGKNFKKAYKAYWDKNKDDKYGKKEKVSYNQEFYVKYMASPTTSQGKYLEGLENRRKSEWILFQTGWFDHSVNAYCSNGDSDGSGANITTKLTGEKKEKMQKLIARAIQIANDEDYKYYRYSKARRNDKYYYDCSSFCARLYKEFFNLTIPNTTYGYGSKGYKGSPNSVKLQPGDILYRSDHVELYIGNNKRAGAHTSSYPAPDQISITKGIGNFTKVYRFVE